MTKNFPIYLKEVDAFVISWPSPKVTEQNITRQ